jgi:dihydroneopterin aldolase
MNATISLQQFKVDCLIGCLEDERIREQSLQVDVEIAVDGLDAIKEDKIKETQDYAAIANQIQFILQSSRFHLLESACRFLTKYLVLSPAEPGLKIKVLSVTVRLTKLDALPGDALAQVSCKLNSGDIEFKREQKPWGTVDIIDENDRVGLYRLNVSPGKEIDEHHHEKTRESEYLLQPKMQVSINGASFEPMPAASVFDWKSEQRHAYFNSSNKTCSILCVDEPPFNPQDEILSAKRMVS